MVCLGGASKPPTSAAETVVSANPKDLSTDPHSVSAIVCIKEVLVVGVDLVNNWHDLVYSGLRRDGVKK